MATGPWRPVVGDRQAHGPGAVPGVVAPGADGSGVGAAPDEAVLSVLGRRYIVGAVLGYGGAATVYRAWDEQLGRSVAVKVFSPEAQRADHGALDREVAALSRLDHPGLVALYDSGVEDERAFLVMRLVDGPTLAARLAEGPLSAEAVTVLAAQLAESLAVMHAAGVTHRDVKPANVLLAVDRALLADFGVARLIGVTTETASGHLVGTAAYLAPEQIGGDGVGPAADIYALGLVLMECLSGRTEYPGSVWETVAARLHRTPVVPPDLPGGLTPLLRAMTGTDPTGRPTAAEMLLALRSGRDGASQVDDPQAVTAPLPVALGVAPPVVPPCPPPTIGAVRRLVVVLAGVAAAAVLITGLIGAAALDPASTVPAISPNPVLGSPCP